MLLRATLTALMALAIGAPPGSGEDTPDPTRRTVQIRSVIRVVDVPEGARHLDLWAPIPRVSPYQEVRDLQIDSPFPPRLTREERFGNRMAWFGIDNPPASIEIGMSFTVTRIENAFGSLGSDAPPEPEWALRPATLIPITSRGREIALDQVDVSAPVMEKARALYDHTNAAMVYDKTGDGWGRGDFRYACDVRRGNCTDYHSYFIGLCRNIGIPAFFEIGYAVPAGETEGTIPGYHCWAYFLDDGRWIPVDISEGDKHPDRKDYFFGHLDTRRVAISRGRDIVLSPPQQEGPLNYFVFPYAEVDGRAHPAVDIDLRFTEISGL